MGQPASLATSGTYGQALCCLRASVELRSPAMRMFHFAFVALLFLGCAGASVPPATCDDLQCADGVSCTESDDGAVCGACPDGFAGDGETCSDIDECATENGGCDALTLCMNTSGSFACGDCPSGYEGDGSSSCTDIDECLTDNGGCSTLAECTNTEGSVQCGDCPTGYVDDGDACLDIDECITENGGCDALTTCTNSAGSFACGACPAGFMGDGTSGCVDIDECATNNGGCDVLTTCTNNAGSFSCGACPAGFSGDGTSGCADIDECASNNGGCDDLTTCTNDIGSFVCGACPAGFSGDGASGCVDIDECATDNGGCDDPLASTCTNNIGAEPTCECAGDDGFEPNQTPATATPLASIAGQAAGGNEDWFTFEVARRATREVSFAAEAGVDIELFDAQGTLLEQSVSNGGTVSLIAQNTADIPSSFDVRVNSAAFCVPYTLDASCNDDEIEPNDDIATAALLVSGAVHWVQPSSSDIFSVTVGAFETTQVSIENVFGDAVTIRALDASGLVLDADVDVQIAGTVTIDNGAGAASLAAFIEVTSADCTQYRLTESATCFDASEPNDLWDTAGLLVASAGPVSGSASQSDEDWYSLAVVGDELVDIVATGGVAVTVFDEFGQVAELPLGNQTTSPRVFTIRVRGAVACTGYTLDVVDATCTPDAFEDNDTAATASVLSFSSELTAEDADDDHYEFSVAAGATVSVIALFTHDQSDLDMRVSEAGVQVGNSSGIRDSESIAVTNATGAASTFTARVFPFDGICAPYVFGVTTCPDDDAREPNDSRADAGSLTSGVDLILNQITDDWFQTEVLPGETLDVAISFLDATADLDLELFDAHGELLDSSTSISDGEAVSVRNDLASPQTVFVRAFIFRSPSADNGCNTYDLSVTR